MEKSNNIIKFYAKSVFGRAKRRIAPVPDEWENGGLRMKEPLKYIGIQTENKEANNDTFSK